MEINNFESDVYNGYGTHQYWFITNEERPAYVKVKDNVHLTFWIGEKNKKPVFGRHFVEMVKILEPGEKIGYWLKSWEGKLELDASPDVVQKCIKKLDIRIIE